MQTSTGFRQALKQGHVKCIAKPISHSVECRSEVRVVVKESAVCWDNATWWIQRRIGLAVRLQNDDNVFARIAGSNLQGGLKPRPNVGTADIA